MVEGRGAGAGGPGPTGIDDPTFRNLFEAAPVAAAVFAIDGPVLEANAEFCRLFGYEPGSLGSVTAEDLTHPDDWPRTIETRDLMAAGGTDRVDVDKRYVRRDGEVFWGHMAASINRDADGVVWGVLVVVEDVTERVRIRAALEASESRFRALVQNATDAILVTDADAHLLWASPSTETLTGARIEDYLGEDILQFIHPDDLLVSIQTFANTASNPGAAAPLRLRIQRIDGEVRLVEAIGTNLLADPAVEGIVFNLRDITDAEEVASTLELTETRYRHLLENISDSVSLVDAEGKLLLGTGSIRRVMGYSPVFWQDRNGFELVHPDDLPHVQRAFAELVAGPGEERIVETRVLAADGTWLDAEIIGRNLLDHPHVRAIVITSRDITDRRRVERQLAEAHDRAVRALQMRTEFIASVSHELRTPIHGILGLSELLATAALDEEARGLARSIGRATDALRMVLDDILDFSKIEVDRLEITHAPVDLAEMAVDLAALFGPQAEAKGIDLVSEIDPALPRVIVSDALRVRQVLNNLIGNAIKFTEVGEVRVVAEVVRASVDRPFDEVRVSVRDTGIGIPADAHDRLFEPFSQVHRSSVAEFGGTGLGLSIAKRLVELLGGAMGYTSEQGRGSAFWFTLPLVLPADGQGPGGPEGDAGQAVAGLDRRRVAGRVLVVEDNPINQLLVTRQLERLDYEPFVVDSGLAALDCFVDVDAAVVLMDWQLPGIDGLETTRRLRTLEADLGRRRTPVVAITASALAGDRERCLAADMDDFIAKPVSIATLGETLARWVRREPDAPPPAVSPVVGPVAGPVAASGAPLTSDGGAAAWRRAGERPSVTAPLGSDPGPVGARPSLVADGRPSLPGDDGWIEIDALDPVPGRQSAAASARATRSAPAVGGTSEPRSGRGAVTASGTGRAAPMGEPPDIAGTRPGPGRPDGPTRAPWDGLGAGPPDDLAPTPSPSEVLDGAVLDALVVDLADASLVATVVRTYLRELDGRVSGIAAALATDDLRSLERTAHTLKSTSAVVGATGLAERCRLLEAVAAAGAVPAPTEADGVQAEADAVARALRGELERLGAAGGD